MALTIPTGDIDVLCIGELLVDLISEEPVATLADAETYRRYQGGSPANIAANVARLGGHAAIIGKVGADAFGRYCIQELAQLGVITDGLIEDPASHTTAIFVSRTSATPDFEVYRGADARLRPDEIWESAIENTRLLHASTFALSRQSSRNAVTRALEVAHHLGKTISLDPNYSPRVWPDRDEALAVLKDLYRFVSLTKPSLDDAQRLFGTGLQPEEYITRFHNLGPELVVMTLGRGGVIVSIAGRMVHIPGLKIDVIDATGAGDCFWAGYLVSLLDGHNPIFAAHVAQAVAARKLGQAGPLPHTLNRQAFYQQVHVMPAVQSPGGIVRNPLP
ncbi:MAG: sugar kinase [Chloroflexota bacterium]|nr:sugar kinase [Chloroflexota bacterium]